MNTSSSIAKLAPALVAAQAEFRAIEKDSTNPDYRSSYASLDHIVAAVRPILAKHELCVVQGATEGPDAKMLVVVSRLIHSSGEWIESSVMMPLVGRMMKGGGRAEPDPQSGGSALSYGRRYGVSALLNLVTGEDDDGNAASRPAKRSRDVGHGADSRKASGDDRPRSVSPTPQSWTGAPADMPMPFGETKGQKLSDHSSKHLQSVLAWLRKPERDGKFAELADAIGTVLADRALGEDPVSQDKRFGETLAKGDDHDGLPFEGTGALRPTAGKHS